jgi:cyclomaltodextrinase / maltogenic alpha-amylase / neopullulanase
VTLGPLSDTPRWVRDAVFYQIFPDRFAASARVEKPGPLEAWEAPPSFHGFKGGDLLGIVERLDYLAELGVNALYLTPIFSSASSHRYHTYDYYHVDPLLGGDDALRELLDECHRREMRVVLDGVFNHSGRGFWPFHHVAENGIGSPYLDWFYVDHQRLAEGRLLHPYPTDDERRQMDELRLAGRPLGEASLEVLGYRAWWDLPALPKLNSDNPQMREHLLGVAEHWLRFGIDGWRLDVPEEIEVQFWREFRQRVKSVNPDAYIVAEIWREKPEWLAGDTFDGLMNYPLTEAIISFVAAAHLDMEVVSTQHEYREFIRRTDGPAFASQLERLLTTYRPEATAAQLNLLGSHDTPRLLSVAGEDRASVMLAVLAQMTLPGAPCIYYGDEIGIAGRHDPDNRRAFPWGRQRWDQALRAFVVDAIALRHAEPILRHGTYRTLAARGGAVSYARQAEGEAAGDGATTALVAINAGQEPVRLDLDAGVVGRAELEAVPLAGMGQATLVPAEPGSTTLALHVPARSGAVFLARGARRAATLGG